VNDNVQFSAFTKRELGKLAKTFQTMGDEAVEESRKVAYDISLLAQSELSQLDILAQKQIRPSGESLMVHQSLAVVKRDGYLMVSLISVYQVEAQPEHFGKAWNSDQRSSNNFQLGQGERQGAAQMATSSFQPFAKFSLN
jgi:hypothetical protein